MSEPASAGIAARLASYFGPGKERRRLFALFAAAFALRLYYLHALGNTPFFGPLTPMLDDGVYNLRGREIAAGSWLGGPSWLIYTTPLYPYFLGLVYRIFGYSIGAAHFIQTSLGALTPVLVYGLAREAFGSGRTAAFAGIASALYIPLIFYENMLLGETLALFLILCALTLLSRALNRGEGVPGRAFLSGLLLGAAALLRPNIVIPAGCCALYLGLFLAFARGRKGRGAGLFPGPAARFRGAL